MTRRECLAAAIVFVAPCVFYFPVTLGQQIFFAGDYLLWLYPIRDVLARAMAEGRLPLWEPTIAAGFPLFAEGQVGALRPVCHILYRALPVHLALGYELLFHLGVMMLGMFCFARSLRLRIPAAFLAALVLPASGYQTDYLLSLGGVFTFAHLPWMLWLLEKIVAETRRRMRVVWFLLLCLVAFYHFIGHPYFLLIGLGVLTCYAACWRWHHGQSSPTRGWQSLGIACAAMLIALGLAAIQILPTIEISRFSTRAGGFSYEDFTIYSIAPEYLLLLVVPYALGSPADIPGGIIGYLGILPFLLALLAPLVVRERRTFFWLILALGGLALAMGKYNPIFPLLFRLPGVSSLRMAGNFMAVFTLGMTMLAAIMFDWLVGRAAQSAGRTMRFPVVVSCLAGLIAVEIVLAYRLSLQDWLTVWTWLPGALLVLAVLVLWAAVQKKLARPWLAVMVIGLAVFDLVAFSAVYLQSRNAMVPMQAFVRAPQSLQVLQTRAGESRILTMGAMVPPFAPAKESLFPDLNTLYGIESVKGTTGLMLHYARDYTDNFSPGMLNLANARYLLLPQFPPDALGRAVSQPSDKFGLRLGKDKIDLPAMPAAAVEVESYIENAIDLADGAQIGSIVFFLDDGTTATMPLRVGIETAAWAIERDQGRSIPPIAATFPAFSGESFRGHTFRARLDFSGGTRALVGIQLAPDSRSDILRLEHIRLLDDQGTDTLLDYLLGASNHSTVYRNDLVTVIENHDLLPRAFLVHTAQVLDDAAALARLRAYTFDPRQSVLLAEGEALTDESPEQDEDESVQITLYQPERMRLNVTAKRKAYLVLSDTWYPGWIARIDGKPAPIQRAYYTFRAVAVDAGTHLIEFEFHPASFYQGAAISIVTLFCLVVGVGWALG